MHSAPGARQVHHQPAHCRPDEHPRPPPRPPEAELEGIHVHPRVPPQGRPPQRRHHGPVGRLRQHGEAGAGVEDCAGATADRRQDAAVVTLDAVGEELLQAGVQPWEVRPSVIPTAPHLWVSDGGLQITAPHVAILPSAGLGHLTISVRLAVALASHDCLVTLITPRPIVSDAESRYISDLRSTFPHIRLLDFHLLLHLKSSGAVNVAAAAVAVLHAIRHMPGGELLGLGCTFRRGTRRWTVFTLSGGHFLGTARCTVFTERIYNFARSR